MPMTVKPANLLGQYLRKNVSSSKVGVVVSAGKMSKAVKVRIAGQEWNKHIRKYFPRPTTYIVADPNSSLIEGDVVRIASGFRFSKSIRHVVTAIVAPFGPPVEERPPVLTEEQLMAKRLEERLQKDVRSKQNGRLASIWRIKEARKAGYKIPDLESAMANVKLAEAAQAARAAKEKGGVPMARQGELSSRERKREQKDRLLREEFAAGEEARKARQQAAQEKAQREATEAGEKAKKDAKVSA